MTTGNAASWWIGTRAPSSLSALAKLDPWSSFGRAGGSPRMQVREDQPVGRHAPVVCALAGDDAELLWMRGGDRGERRSCQRRGDFAR